MMSPFFAILSSVLLIGIQSASAAVTKHECSGRINDVKPGTQREALVGSVTLSAVIPDGLTSGKTDVTLTIELLPSTSWSKTYKDVYFDVIERNFVRLQATQGGWPLISSSFSKIMNGGYVRTGDSAVLELLGFNFPRSLGDGKIQSREIELSCE